MPRGNQRWRPSKAFRPFVKTLGTDKDATKKLFAELEREAKAQAIPREEVNRLKADVNDWAIAGLERAEKQGVTDWDSEQAAKAFGFSDE
jgi:hypothetical protein